MSYSINLRDASKAALKEKAQDALRKCLEGQPAHNADKEMICAAVAGAIDAVDEQAGRDVVVVCYGHAGGRWENGTYVSIDTIEMTLKVYTVASAPAA